MKITGIEGLCIMLLRLPYPNRLSDLIPIFGLHPTHLSSIFNKMVNHFYDMFRHNIRDLDHPWMSQTELERYANVIHGSRAPVTNCWGFIDNKVMPICRPSRNQEEVYNGHKRTHSLKYQSIMIPNGLIANMFVSMEGHRHNAALLHFS